MSRWWKSFKVEISKMNWNFDNLGKMRDSRREIQKTEKSGKGGCWLKLDQDGWCK